MRLLTTSAGVLSAVPTKPPIAPEMKLLRSSWPLFCGGIFARKGAGGRAGVGGKAGGEEGKEDSFSHLFTPA
jgi:hypothetical protein